MVAKRRPVRFVFMSMLLIAAMAILVGLGTWQLQRLAWKEDLIATMTERRQAAPVTISEIEAMVLAGQDIDYRPARLSGVFDHGKENYFLATLDGEPGFHVYTAFRLDDGRFVLVNRGFIPENRRDFQSRKVGLPEGRVEISGLARAKLAAKPGFFLPDNEGASTLFFWKDLDEMAKSAGLPLDRVLPFFVDAGPNADPAVLPKGGVTIIDLPNNHLQYALTWYGLAIALAGVTFFSFFKERRERRSNRDQASIKP